MVFEISGLQLPELIGGNGAAGIEVDDLGSKSWCDRIYFYFPSLLPVPPADSGGQRQLGRNDQGTGRERSDALCLSFEGPSVSSIIALANNLVPSTRSFATSGSMSSGQRQPTKDSPPSTGTVAPVM